MDVHEFGLTYRIFAACLLVLAFLLFLQVARPSPVHAECHRIEVTEWSPTGIAGCEVYGEGLASWWSGPGVAVNSCLWPWKTCQLVRVYSISTGLSLIVRPTMFCDCYTGTANQRLVDLDPAALKALGLWEIRDQGLFPVRVSEAGPSATTVLPDTAMTND